MLHRFWRPFAVAVLALALVTVGGTAVAKSKKAPNKATVTASGRVQEQVQAQQVLVSSRTGRTSPRGRADPLRRHVDPEEQGQPAAHVLDRREEGRSQDPPEARQLRRPGDDLRHDQHGTPDRPGRQPAEAGGRRRDTRHRPGRRLVRAQPEELARRSPSARRRARRSTSCAASTRGCRACSRFARPQ